VNGIGELIESIAGRAGLKNVREVGERLTKPDRSPAVGRADELLEKLMDVIGSDLLDHGQTVITGMKNTTGQGDPDRGDVFGDTQSTFDGLDETLRSAVPGNDWDGAGSYAYADQNTRQQLRAEAMADADHEVHKVLFREAAQITLRRGYLDDQCNFLANTSYVTFPLQFIPRYGEAMKMAIEVAALQAALGESYHQMTRLRSEVAQNVADLQQAVGRYSGVADGAELLGGAEYFDPPPPPLGGGSLPGAIPIERSPQRVTPAGIAGPSSISGGDDPVLAGDCGAMITADKTLGPQPIMAGLPPLPQVPPLPQMPPLGSVLSPVGGPAATPGQRRSKKAARPRDDEDEYEDEDEKDPTNAAPGDAESERAPVDAGPDSNPDPLQTPLAARLDSWPVLPAATMMTAPLTLTA